MILFTVSTNFDISLEIEWYDYFIKKKTPVVAIINKTDTNTDETRIEAVREATKEEPLLISAKTGDLTGILDKISY